MSTIGNLIFFTEKGYEIPVLKSYTLEWELIPNDLVKNNFIEIPRGHFEIEEDDETGASAKVIIDNPGKILKYDVILQGQYNKTIKISKLEDICLLNISYNYIINKFPVKYNITEDKTDYIYNQVKLTINLLDDSSELILPIDIFKNIYFNNPDTDHKNISGDVDTYFTVNSITLSKNNNGENIILYLIKNVFNNSTELLYPGVIYKGVIKQDKVSTEFVSANTIVILSENNNEYKHPLYNETKINLLFKFLDNSEMKFISSNTVADIIWDDEMIISYNKTDENNPGYFTIGFLTDIEGCYQNMMAMYAVNKDLPRKHLCGIFSVLTEVEGEDERYRALLGNLGIPDPANYANIFKSLDYLEELVDWTLVNNKSKELMINYDNIFPYAGTYKSLLNAVKFLGYYDLIFKEWYKIKDLNNRDRYVILLTYDTVTGKSLKSKLKSINVNFGEFERYKKLNRLTMVYHIDLIDENNDNETIKQYVYDGSIYKSSNITFDIPLIKKIYEYRTDEILAKLYSVKVWLENHILGVNCYISDICGEGVIIDRVKSLAYVTEHYLNDFYSEAYITPKITNISEFKKSKATITCSLNEYNSVSFETYKNTPIDAFIKKEETKRCSYTGKNIDLNIYYSNPLGCLILADEIQYELHTKDCKSGSLYEFMIPHNTSHSNICECNPIIIQDNNIVMYDNEKHTAYIDDTECPIIELAEANIRTVYGNWKDNIKYSISSKIDPKTGNEYYIASEINDSQITNLYNDIRKLFLYPDISGNGTNPYETKTKFIYTSENQWNVPMIIIRNYKCDSLTENIIQELDYILEIIKGRLIFRNKITDISNGSAVGAEVLLGYDDLSFDDIRQSISIDYTYTSDRIPIYTYPNSIKNTDKLSILNELENTVDYNTTCDILVNRACDYTVTVKGFDAYNHIYTNKSDKRYTVYTNPINIEMYLNSAVVKNKKSFHDSILKGILLNADDCSTLLYDIGKNSEPLHPKSYRIYDIDVMQEYNNIIEYDNISYAIDVPQEKDYIVFNNFTERISSIKNKVTNNSDNDTNTATIYLYDGNPNPNTIKYADTIGICLYDNIKKEIIEDISPIKVINKLTQNTSFGTSTVYNNADTSIVVNDTSNIVSNLSTKLNEHIYGYVYNTTSIKISQENIYVDYDNNETTIILNDLYYNIGDVIKLCYYHEYTENEKVCNEACYRIKNIYEYDEIIKEIVNDVIRNKTIHIVKYVLAGIFDLYKLNNKLYNNITEHGIDTSNANLLTYEQFNIYISPAHLSAALYILRAMSNGEEITSVYNGAIILRTQVKYEAGPLLFDSYLDTNYSAVIYKYNPNILDNMWINDISTYYKNSDNIYKYNNVPVTIDKGRIIIVKYDEKQDILYNNELPYNIQWNWYSHLVETVSNPSIKRDYLEKRLIFSSKNNILPLIPDILGPLTIELVVTDIYGNRIINEGSGLLYILTPKKIYVKRKTPIKYNIPKYAKRILDINIEENNSITPSLYGAARSVNNIIAADGETITLYIDNGLTFKSTKSAGMLYPVNILYTIYYSDGSVLYNKGAKLTLLDENGNAVKDNKIKVKFSKAKQGHKHIAKTFKVKLHTLYNMEKDIVQDKIIDIPIMQYGNIKTTLIYDLKFSLHDIEQSGVDELNNEFWDSMIYDVSYTMKRSDDSIEYITGDSLLDTNLIIKDYKYISTKSGYATSIEENKMKKRTYIGILKVTVLFYVHGVIDTIETSYTTLVYQD